MAPSFSINRHATFLITPRVHKICIAGTVTRKSLSLCRNPLKAYFCVWNIVCTSVGIHTCMHTYIPCRCVDPVGQATKVKMLWDDELLGRRNSGLGFALGLLVECLR